MSKAINFGIYLVEFQKVSHLTINFGIYLVELQKVSHLTKCYSKIAKI
jgi:hypothetical protein